MIRFSGIEDLEAHFRNLSVQRLKWSFLHREAGAVAFALGITLPPELRSEGDKMAHIKREILNRDQGASPRKCNCDAVPEGLRWTRFDEDMEANPVKHYIDPSFPVYFHERIKKVVRESDREAFRYKAVVVDNYEEAEVVWEWGTENDGPGNTLGVTIYWVDGTDDIHIEGRKIRVAFDKDDFPVGVDLDVFETVADHENEHVKGNDHTPPDWEQGQNLLDAFFHGVFINRHGPWDRQENHRKYGQPIHSEIT